MTDAPIPPSGSFPPAVPPPVPGEPPASRPAVAPAPAPVAGAMQPIYVHVPRKTNWALRIVLALLVSGLISTLVIVALLGAAVGSGQTGSFTTRTVLEGDKSQVVAIYDVADMIDGRQADRFRSFARLVLRDSSIKAVVLRVDSGGGGVSASDEMHQDIRRMQKAGKKIVVSMGGTAASGAYYISAPADYIYAEPTTVTGSIGVISIVPIIKGTLEKIGAETLVIRSTKATPHKADLNPFEKPSQGIIDDHRALLDKIQARFEKVVADGRGHALTSQEVKDLSNGKVWIADEALELKLVDEIGYQEDALGKAAALAGLGNPKAVRYTERRSLFDMFQSRTTGLTIDRRLIEDLQTPRMMLVWRPQWQ